MFNMFYKLFLALFCVTVISADDTEHLTDDVALSVRPVPSNYDHVMLTLQWPPSVCLYTTPACKQPVPNRWTIHGLWPQGYPSPADCYTPKDLYKCKHD